MRWNTAMGCVGVALAIAGCGGSSDSTGMADFTGDYTVAVTNVSNDCQFATWTIGQTASGVPFKVTQSGSTVTGVVGGVVATTYYDVVLGSDTFTGTGSGNHVTMVIHGTRSFTKSKCTYTVTATMNGDLSGDTLTGTIDYSAATNGSPDCAPLGACASTQKFNGVRPPKQ